MTTTTICHLQRYFPGFPLKNLRAVRLTCKRWDTLSKKRSFTEMHAAKEGNPNSRMIVLMDDKLYLTSVVVNGTDVDPCIESQGKLTCLNEQVVKINEIFHCEGLLLCILRDTSRIVVWNPYWGQTRWIEPRYSYSMYEYRYELGYSKNKKKKKNKSHKILRFIDRYFCPSTRRRHLFLWYEIYNFDTGLWKTLDITSPHWRIVSSVSLKGNAYWISYASRETKAEPHVYLICFDFTKEKFGRLPGGLDGEDLATLSCVREEKLAVFYQYDD